MFHRYIILWTLVLLSLGFSFADYFLETESCDTITMNACKEKVYKKYQISKNKACVRKDWLYSEQPLQVSRPKKKAFSSQFYKYNNILYYTVDVYPLKNPDFYNTEHYLYSYNCKTKKVLNMNVNYANDKSAIINILNAYKNNLVLRFTADEWYGWLFMFDAKKLLLHEFSEMSSMKNYTAFEKLIKDKIKPTFDATQSKEISIGMWTYPTKIAWGDWDSFWNSIEKRIGSPGFSVSSVEIKNWNLLARIDVKVWLYNPNNKFTILDGELTLAQLNLNTRTIVIP